MPVNNDLELPELKEKEMKKLFERKETNKHNPSGPMDTVYTDSEGMILSRITRDSEGDYAVLSRFRLSGTVECHKFPTYISALNHVILESLTAGYSMPKGDTHLIYRTENANNNKLIINSSHNGGVHIQGSTLEITHEEVGKLLDALGTYHGNEEDRRSEAKRESLLKLDKRRNALAVRCFGHNNVTLYSEISSRGKGIVDDIIELQDQLMGLENAE